jgi:hypothetical protein
LRQLCLDSETCFGLCVAYQVNDANNYLDTRNECMTDDQGTVRVDHSFGNRDTVFLRYSAASEYGLMPEGLPSFGLYRRIDCM